MRQLEPFNVRKMAEYVDGLLKRQLESENIYIWRGRRHIPKLSTAAVWWMNDELYTVIRIETEMGIAYVGYISNLILVEPGNFEVSLEQFNAQQLWSGQLAGDYLIGAARFDDQDLIVWKAAEDSDRAPATWQELHCNLRAEAQIWLPG
ncbi:hypothetical protein CAMM_01845 [Corynebacterium ammoniagenes DSM 20306]|nr:hypothetical protein CAMM_01845 [Corynebacterium ammoniagenes DSM 20306]AQS72837.1 hypothetical protein CA40472_02170 [Corynebacterium ammoniagenes]EFG80869.1 hypothetical protein HMPREF0281_01917 [Corynebacterium ammoniagenes DSM 20306]